MPDFRVDIPRLAECTEQCFDLSGDGRLPESEQKRYLQKGRQLRVRLRELIVIRFESETDALKSANTALEDVNTKLKTELEAINKAAETIQAIADLVGKLDAVIGDVSAVILPGV